jgi:hypothetical protein
MVQVTHHWVPSHKAAARFGSSSPRFWVPQKNGALAPAARSGMRFPVPAPAAPLSRRCPRACAAGRSRGAIADETGRIGEDQAISVWPEIRTEKEKSHKGRPTPAVLPGFADFQLLNGSRGRDLFRTIDFTRVSLPALSPLPAEHPRRIEKPEAAPARGSFAACHPGGRS